MIELKNMLESTVENSELAKTCNETMDEVPPYDDLDVPINFSGKENETGSGSDVSSESTGSLAETDASSSVAFTGNEHNYEYYKKEANNHKFWAEKYEQEAKNSYDMASRYADDKPEKVQSYVSSAENWSRKADSEWQAYRDDLNKADSYK